MGALILLVLVPAFFGLNPVTARALVGDFEPATLTFIRWSLAAVVIGMVALSRGAGERWRVGRAELGRLLVLGALGMGFCSYAAYAGVQTATATTVGLIYACTAALVAAWGILRGTQRATALLGVGLLACVVGVALILTRGDLTALADLRIGKGELWALAGTAVWAGYTVAMTRQTTFMTPFAQFTLMAAAAAAACVPAMALELAGHPLPAPTPRILGWLAGLVLLTGCAAFLGYNISLRLNGPVLTSASISLAPLYIAAMAIFLIGEEVAWYHLAAIAMVVAGLLAIQQDRRRA